jgi:hypothetical protein
MRESSMICNSTGLDHFNHLFSFKNENLLRNYNTLREKTKREGVREQCTRDSQDVCYSHLFVSIEWLVSSGNLIFLWRAEVLNEGTNLINL